MVVDQLNLLAAAHNVQLSSVSRKGDLRRYELNPGNIIGFEAKMKETLGLQRLQGVAKYTLTGHPNLTSGVGLGSDQVVALFSTKLLPVGRVIDFIPLVSHMLISITHRCLLVSMISPCDLCLHYI